MGTTLFAYACLLPALLVLGAFVFYPILRGLPLAFTNYSVVGETAWVGWANFARALTDPAFRAACRNTLTYLLVVPCIQVLAILLAWLVNRRVRGIALFRAAYFLPVVTSMVAVAILWGWIYQEQGLLNHLLIRAGLLERPVGWLSDPRLALPAVMLVTLWKGLGYYMVIYLAGLQSIPRELEEAAAVDGCGTLGVVRHITVPLLRPFILFAALISAQAALHVFDEVAVMTDGGPVHATLTVALYAYKMAFKQFDFGYGAAISWLLGVISWVLVVLLFRAYRERGVGPVA